MEQSGLSTAEVLTATVPLRTGLTAYARTGDCPILTVGALALLVGPLMRLLHLRRVRKRNGPAVRLVGRFPG